MAKSLKVLQPRYFSDFHCISEACEDSCCEDAAVIIDKETYEKYKTCGDDELKPIFDQKVLPNEASLHDATFAYISASHSGCPFLTDNHLCSIQKRLSEAYLSRTCSVYPRAISLVDGIHERSLYLSCPEAARVVLLNPEPTVFDSLDAEPRLRFTGFPTLSTKTAAGGSSVKPYKLFQEIRSFVHSLLQNRSYKLWERLVILGMYLDQLNTMVEADEAAPPTVSIPDHIASYRDHIDRRLFTAALQGIGAQHAMQLTFALSALSHRVESDPAGKRFLECYEEFLEGLEYTEDSSPAEASGRYVAVHDRYYKPYMEEREYILENYLINYAFRNLFPFGAQTGIYLEHRTIYSDYVLMMIHFILVRSLLIGVAGRYRDLFGTDQIVKLIQSYAKAVEHNLPYQKRLLQSVQENGIGRLPVLATLIKIE